MVPRLVFEKILSKKSLIYCRFSTSQVIFNIVNFSKTKSLYREGMSPLVKSTSRSKWQHIPAKNVFYYKSPEHHKNYLMSFAFAFDKETDVYQFAYSYPYTYNRLQVRFNFPWYSNS